MPFHQHARRAGGFTLIELMIVVGVIAILAAVAIPNYARYVTRSKIIDATTRLSDLRSQMEKYFLDNRQYTDIGGSGKCGVDVAPTIAAKYNADPGRDFDLACNPISATAYSLSATGIAARGMGGFIYTVDQNNVKGSTVPAAQGWSGTGNACWVIRQDGAC